jgi:hypothetical protein
MVNTTRRCALLLGTMLCLLVAVFVQPRSSHASRIDVWGTKPVLAYFVLNPQFRDRLRHDLALSPPQFATLQQIAVRESEKLQNLDRESRAIITNDALSMDERRVLIERSNYNERVLATLANGQKALAAALGSTQEQALIAWIERHWVAEQQAHGVPHVTTASRTYRIFSTQYVGETSFEVSLPDKCLKFANRGWADASCSAGYQRGQNYSVQLGYNGRGTTSLVWDVGPWNEDDAYWSTTNDAQPRRRFTDLPQGLPEAQAAYFNGYNGGRDQFGRIVANPAGIDLGEGVRQALGLAYLENTWIDVTYLWTSGGSVPAPTPPPTPTPTPPPVPVPAGILVRDRDDPNVERGGAQQYLNSAPAGSITANGHATWTHNTRSTLNNYVRWKPPLDRCGNWEVLAFMPYVANNLVDTANAVYRIRHRGGESTRVVDQHALTQALGAQRTDRWISLGTYTWSANAGAAGEYVFLGDFTGETTARSVNFDDLVWVYRGTSDACGGSVGVPVPTQPRVWLPMLR